MSIVTEAEYSVKVSSSLTFPLTVRVPLSVVGQLAVLLELPTAVDLLAIAASAGLSPEQALLEASRRTDDPLRREQPEERRRVVEPVGVAVGQGEELAVAGGQRGAGMCLIVAVEVGNPHLFARFDNGFEFAQKLFYALDEAFLVWEDDCADVGQFAQAAQRAPPEIEDVDVRVVRGMGGG